MYVAVKGGEKAIRNAHALFDDKRRGDTSVPEITPNQIREQLSFSVDRVMSEGSLYDPDLSALAIKQARGDLIEAIFLIRASRTTLPRFGSSKPLDTSKMKVERRISATYKDIPGGQILGATFDYQHRLLDFSLVEQKSSSESVDGIRGEEALDDQMPRVLDILNDEGLIEQASLVSDESTPPPDLTREPLDFPANRSLRLQNLARADEGFLLSMGYSTQRGYARSHPFVGEIRIGAVAVEFAPEELGFPIEIGEIVVSECEMINQFMGSKTAPPQFTQGYGLAFGQVERKVMSMALVDRALRADELGEEKTAPAQDEEFVLSHSDNVKASGFVEHLKLPHYVDFQAELELVRKMRATSQVMKEAAE